jgi:3-dehydroquinate synthase
VAACNLSEIISKLHLDEAVRIVKLLSRYHLPVDIETDVEKVYEILRLDKKREGDDIRFILLNGIGKPEVRPISIAFLHENLKSIL